VRSWIKGILETQRFNQAIMILILANTAVMAVDRYDISEQESQILYYINLALTIVFVIEIILKVFGLGPKEYLRDGFNIFDSLVIVIGLLEYVGINTRVTTVFRTFRLLRVFKIARSWHGLRKLLKTVLASLSSLATLALLMVLLIFIYSLIGM
jgi:voltage-dependent calcium channel T type alpha-1I